MTDEHSLYLYRMPDDLVEKQNLANQYPEVVKDLFSKLQVYRSFQPKDSVPVYRAGKEGFKPWTDWRIEPPK